MKSFRFTLAILFIATFAMIACSDDESTPTDTGGTPPDDTNSSNVCSRELCAENAALKQECEEFLANCLAMEEFNQEECVGGAWVICNGK